MASRLVTRGYDRALAPAALTINSYSILARLERDGPLALGALADRLATDRTTLSREIAPLVRSGLVQAGPDPDDRRRRLLSLSHAGAARLIRARPLWNGAQRDLAAAFGAARTSDLLRELRELVGVSG